MCFVTISYYYERYFVIRMVAEISKATFVNSTYDSSLPPYQVLKFIVSLLLDLETTWTEMIQKCILYSH